MDQHQGLILIWVLLQRCQKRVENRRTFNRSLNKNIRRIPVNHLVYQGMKVLMEWIVWLDQVQLLNSQKWNLHLLKFKKEIKWNNKEGLRKKKWNSFKKLQNKTELRKQQLRRLHKIIELQRHQRTRKKNILRVIIPTNSNWTRSNWMVHQWWVD